jgi:hypothetical protein
MARTLAIGDSLLYTTGNTPFSDVIGLVTCKRAYTEAWSSHPTVKFPDKNFSHVITTEMSTDQYSHLIAQHPRVDLTNMIGRNDTSITANGVATGSNAVFLGSIKSAIDYFPSIEHILVIEAPPRINSMRTPSSLSNLGLRDIITALPTKYTRKIQIARHVLNRIHTLRYIPNALIYGIPGTKA